MYEIIDAKRSVRTLYTEALIGRGDITVQEAEEALRDYQEQLEKVFLETRDAGSLPGRPPLAAQPEDEDVVTATTLDAIKRIGDAHVSLPTGFAVHQRLQRVLERRAAMATEGGVDWGMGELLAFGSLLMQGIPVRLAGQDSRRGTFVQRHAVLHDKTTGEEYTPLRYLDEEQARFWVYDSLLSEYAAMGFEYGYSVANPKALVLWEAQFGDFANGAQSIIDEFISSGEAKWGQRSDVTLLLPHGYEGQGPDHSSGRIERFLQLFADNNMWVVYPTSPANYFHLLRKQALGKITRPLTVFTPKSLLRHRLAVSAVEDFTAGTFQPVIDDGTLADRSAVRRVLLSTGKVYYDLVQYRQKAEREDVAIVRVEQLAPIPVTAIERALAGYPNATEFIWVQDEPLNQGAWPFVALNLPGQLPGLALQVRARQASSAPATGSGKRHEAEQAALVESAFA